jgi:hypothetical protein
MPDTLATLTFDDEKDNGVVDFTSRYHELDHIEKLDFIRDSVSLLADEYRRLIVAEYPHRRIDTARGVPVQDFLIAPIVS